jgi:LysM repeat protein
VIRFTAVDAPSHSNAAELRLDPGLAAALPSSLQLRIIADSQPTLSEAAGLPSPGGVVAQSLARPLDIQLIATGRASGQVVPLPAAVASLIVEVRLPQPAFTSGPDEEVAWLMELDDADGQFLGYVRPPSALDPSTQQVVLMIPVSQLRGTLFLPVLLRTTYVRNFDPGVHIWSSPLSDAVDFGLAAPQWSRMQVLAPRISQRLPVLNSFTGEPGWIDAGGVGEVALDDNPPAVAATTTTEPALGSATGPDATLALAAPVQPPSEPQTPTVTATYAVRPGDTLKEIAVEAGASVQALIAANPHLDPDQLSIGQQLNLPSP